MKHYELNKGYILPWRGERIEPEPSPGSDLVRVTSSVVDSVDAANSLELNGWRGFLDSANMVDSEDLVGSAGDSANMVESESLLGSESVVDSEDVMGSGDMGDS